MKLPKLFKTKNKKEELPPSIVPPSRFSPTKEVPCILCGNKTYKAFEAKIMKDDIAEYFWCEHCQFLHIHNPTWLEKAYQHPVTAEDTGVLLRNEHIRNILSPLLYSLYKDEGKFLDFAGGYGFLTRLMRDVGFDFYWHDKYCQNVTAIGFEGSATQNYDAITAMESFEHFVNPIAELENMLQISKTIIFSTETLPPHIPNPKDWWYYCLNHGQHISLYTKESLLFLAQKYKLNYYSIDMLHILTDKKIDIAEIQKLSFDKVRKQMQSKTFSDMEYIINLNK